MRGRFRCFEASGAQEYNACTSKTYKVHCKIVCVSIIALWRLYVEDLPNAHTFGGDVASIGIETTGESERYPSMKAMGKLQIEAMRLA